MHSWRSLIAAAVMMLACSAAGRAQDKPRYAWGVLGLGTGSANIACAGCTTAGAFHGPTMLVTVGLMVSPHLGVGVGLDAWWRSPSDTEVTALGTVLLHYYPSVGAGAFVEAGVGYSRAEVTLDGGNRARGKGVGLMLSVGYDVTVFRFDGAEETARFEVTLTPRLTYVYSPLGDLTYAAGSPPFATGWRHQVLSVGLGVGLLMRQ